MEAMRMIWSWACEHRVQKPGFHGFGYGESYFTWVFQLGYQKEVIITQKKSKPDEIRVSITHYEEDEAGTHVTVLFRNRYSQNQGTDIIRLLNQHLEIQ